MLINDIVKNFISEQIRFDNYKNIQLTTKRIKECNSGVTNSMIFDELINLENGNIIQIQQAARSGKLFNNRKNWIKRKQSICRYVIDILKPEYFEKTSVSENNWAIKAHIYPDVLRAAHVHKFVLFEGTDIRQSYECKFDEDGKFLCWRKS